MLVCFCTIARRSATRVNGRPSAFNVDVADTSSGSELNWTELNFSSGPPTPPHPPYPPPTPVLAENRPAELAGPRICYMLPAISLICYTRSALCHSYIATERTVADWCVGIFLGYVVLRRHSADWWTATFPQSVLPRRNGKELALNSRCAPVYLCTGVTSTAIEFSGGQKPSENLILWTTHILWTAPVWTSHENRIVQRPENRTSLNLLRRQMCPSSSEIGTLMIMFGKNK